MGGNRGLDKEKRVERHNDVKIKSELGEDVNDFYDTCFSSRYLFGPKPPALTVSIGGAEITFALNEISGGGVFAVAETVLVKTKLTILADYIVRHGFCSPFANDYTGFKIIIVIRQS